MIKYNTNCDKVLNVIYYLGSKWVVSDFKILGLKIHHKMVIRCCYMYKGIALTFLPFSKNSLYKLNVNWH